MSEQQQLLDLYNVYFTLGTAQTDEEKWEHLNKLSGYGLNEFESGPEYDDIREIPQTNFQKKYCFFQKKEV